MSFLSKLKDIVGLNDQGNYDYEDAEQYAHDYNDYPAANLNGLTAIPSNTVLNYESVKLPDSNVIGMPRVAQGTTEMVLIEPRAFEEMSQVIDALRQRKSIILNMTSICREEAQRAVDFVAGGTYALDGHYERIGDNIFLFTPSCVQVSTPTNVFNEIVQAPARPHDSVAPSNSWVSTVIAQ